MMEFFEKEFLASHIFVKKAYEEFEALDSERYLIRKDKSDKRLIEEIMPIAKFIKFLEEPNLDIKCKFFSGNQNYDAILELNGKKVEKGFLEASYYLEVTVVSCPKSYLKREKLYKDGIVFGGDCIRRDGSRHHSGSKIVSEATAQSNGEDISKIIDMINKAIENKNAKKYENPCILIIFLEVDGIGFSIKEWGIILAKITTTVNREKFATAFVCNDFNNHVFEIINQECFY